MSVKLVCNALRNGEHVFPLRNISNIVYIIKRAGQQVFKSQSPGQTKDKLPFTWSQKSKVCRSKNIASVLSNLPLHLTGSESLFNKVNHDLFPASSLLKWQVTFEAGLLSLWREKQAVPAALLHLENPPPNGKRVQQWPSLQHCPHTQSCKSALRVAGQGRLSATKPVAD